MKICAAFQKGLLLLGSIEILGVRHCEQINLTMELCPIDIGIKFVYLKYKEEKIYKIDNNPVLYYYDAPNRHYSYLIFSAMVFIALLKGRSLIVEKGNYGKN